MIGRRALFLLTILALFPAGLRQAPAQTACVQVTFSAIAGNRPGGTIVRAGEDIVYTITDRNCGLDIFNTLHTTAHIPLGAVDDTTQGDVCGSPPPPGCVYQPAPGPGAYDGTNETPPEFGDTRFGPFLPLQSYTIVRRVRVPQAPVLPARMCSHAHVQAFFIDAATLIDKLPTLLDLFDLETIQEALASLLDDPSLENAQAVLQVLLDVADPVTLLARLNSGTTDDSGPPDVCFNVVGTAADLSVDVTDAPDPAQSGQNVTYTMTIRNGGPDVATGVTLIDTPPAPGDASFVSATTNQGLCDAAPNPGTGQLQCNLGIMSNGGTATVRVVVTPTHAGTISNSASVTANQPDPLPGDNSDSETTTVNPGADLSITKTASATDVSEGDSITYTLTAHNGGPDTDPSVTITDALPSNVAFDSGTFTAPGGNGSCSESGGTVTCSVGALASGQDAVATIIVHATGPGDATDTATVTGTTGDPNTQNNSDSVTTGVSQVADLSITKTDSPDPARAGEEITYTITVTNAGPSAATNVVVTDNLPAGMTFDSAAPADACSHSSGVVTCQLGAMASGGNAVVTIVATPGADGSYTNTASVSSDESDPNPDDNTASATTTVSSAEVEEVPFDVREQSINKSKPKAGGFPVAFLSTPGFNAATIDPDSVCVGNETDPAGGACTQIRSAIQDVNGDGLPDLQLWFHADDTNLALGDSVTVCAVGETFGGAPVHGCESGIKVI